VAFVLPWLSALTDWAGPSRIAGGAATACAVAMLAAHGRLVLPHLKRAVALVALAAYGVGAAILLTLNHQRNERWFAELYVSVLPPPGLLWVEPLPRAEFLRRAGALRAELDRQVREARDENPDDAAEPE
jgi:hypothetical protein